MKPSILKVAVLMALLALAAAPLFAQSRGSWFTIPFDFIADGNKMPAGDYYVETLNWSAISFGGTNDKPGLVILSKSVEQQDTIRIPKLTFHRFSDRTLLTRIELRNTDYARTFPTDVVTHVIKPAGQVSQVKPEVVVIVGK